VDEEPPRGSAFAKFIIIIVIIIIVIVIVIIIKCFFEDCVGPSEGAI